MSDLFCQFLLALRLSAKILSAKNINSKYEVLNPFCLLVQVPFFGTILGRFSQRNFKIFRRRPAMIPNIFTQPPPPQPYGPGK